jgi:iron complex transport system permease protein
VGGTAELALLALGLIWLRPSWWATVLLVAAAAILFARLIADALRIAVSRRGTALFLGTATELLVLDVGLAHYGLAWWTAALLVGAVAAVLVLVFSVLLPLRLPRWLTGSLVGLVGLLLLMFSALLGAVPIPAVLGVQVLLHQATGGVLYPQACAGTGVSASRCSVYTFIVWNLYVPEVLLALFVGAALGLAGGALQGVFRNPLADPFLLGISSGGTLGAAILYVYRIGVAEADLYLPLFAFIGSAATGLLILAVARGRYGSVETLLLTGVALANLLSAILSLVLLYNPSGSIQVTFWLLGGLGLADWQVDGIAFGTVLALGTLLTLYGRELNLLQLGPDVAQSVGVNARSVRLRVILLASLVTAVAVAFTGIIGFVGLVSPHIVRRLLGTDYRIVLPGSAVVGALFLLSARDVSYLAFPGSLFPLGIFTAFAGVPFFLYLLYRQRRSAPMGVA